MKKGIFIICAILVCCATVFSQKINPHFKSVSTVGFSIGQSPPQLLLQTVNGLIVKDWFAGVGVGLDEYGIKSLPLFADIRWNFGEQKKGFIYGDIGYNFFLEDKSKDNLFAVTVSTYKGGLYSDIGVGLRAKFIKKVNMVFTLGHSYKRIKNTQVTTICGIIPPCFDETSRFTHNYGRINLKVGLEL